ncbi:MAG: MOSC domain-containing protein [Haloplanus sp.]
MTGTVLAIHVAPASAAPMESRSSVAAVAGRGLRGDRYFDGEGTFSDHPGGGRDLTLVEAEALDAVEREVGLSLDFDAHRRNFTTRGVALNHLVGETFRVGDVRCRGVRLCEPCAHLASLTGEDVVDPLTHRGGLRADVVEGGTVRAGDPVTRT